MVALENVDKDIPFLVFISDIFKRLQKFSTRLEEIRSRPCEKKLHSEYDHKKVTPKKNGGSGSPKNVLNCPLMTLTSNGDSPVTVQLQSCDTYTYKGYPTVFESTSKTSFMKLDSANCFHQLAENPISTCKHRGAGDDLKGKGEKKGNLNCIEDMGKSNIGRQPEIKREEYAWDNSEENKTKGQNERNEIKRRLSWWAELLQAGHPDTLLESQFADTERIKNGMI